MSNASREPRNDSSRLNSQRAADSRPEYGISGVSSAHALGPLPPLPFASPFSPPITLPPLPPLHTSGFPVRLQSRRHSAPIASTPSKRHLASPFPPPTTPLPPIPSEDGLVYPGWPASLAAIPQGLVSAPQGRRRSTSRRAPPAWPPSHAPVHEEEEEAEWRHPYAIASSPTRDYQWDRPHGDSDLVGSGSSAGISPLDLPPLDSLPPIGIGGTRRLGESHDQDRVSDRMGRDSRWQCSEGSLQTDLPSHESCARCRSMKPLSRLRAIFANGPLYCSDCRDARKLVAQASPAALATFDASLGCARTPSSSWLPLLSSSNSLFRRENADLDLLASQNRRFSSQEDLDRRPHGVAGLYRTISSKVTGGRGDASKGRVSPIPAPLPETMTGSAPSDMYAMSPGFLDSLRKGRKGSRGGATAVHSDRMPSPTATTSDPWRFMRPPSPVPSPTSRTSPSSVSASGRFSLPPLFTPRSRRGSDTTEAGVAHRQALPVAEAVGTRPSLWVANDPVYSWNQAEGQSRRSSCIESDPPAGSHNDGVAQDSAGQTAPVSSMSKSRRRSFRRSLVAAFQ